MIHRKGRTTDRQLLRPCVLGGTTDETLRCESCAVPCSALEQTVHDLADRVNGTWTAISAAITARRSELDDVLDRLAGIGCSDGAEAHRSRPIRTLIVSPSGPSRAALAGRMADDPRFALAGEASTPAEVVPLAAAVLPDLVLVHLPELARRSLEDLADLGQWAPGSVIVVVSGLDVAWLGDVLVASAVPDNWPRREPSHSGGGSAPGPVGRNRGGGHGGSPGRVNPPRSIIQEAMRQIGVPMRRKS